MNQLTRIISIALFISTTSFAQVGNYIPMPLTLEWVNAPEVGLQFDTASYPDAVFVFEVFRNNCPYCHLNADNVKELNAMYMDDERVKIVDVGMDYGEEPYRAWLERHPTLHPVVKDPYRYIYSQMGQQYIPAVAVVDCTGMIHYSETGVWDGAMKADIKAAIAKAKEITCSI